MIDKVPDRHTRELAHDFNNLLTAIIGAAETVLERSGIDTETRDDIAQIREGARRGAGLIRALREGTYDTAAPTRTMAVNDLIQATARLLAHRLGSTRTLLLVLEAADVHVRADPTQIDRILLNLVVNARHAMPEGGTVTLSTAPVVLTIAMAGVPDTVPPGEYAMVSVSDTGSGIPERELPRIFETGFTSRREQGGSGLGLASVRETARRLGGFLAVESEVGRGTRFDIYLPRQAADAAPVTVAERPMPTGTVLLVEDDPLVRQIAQRVLLRAGWTVLCADSAKEALTILRRDECDLMITDISMPGMDGVILTRLALVRSPELPVILTSGYEEPLEDGRFGDGVVGFLTKPYDQADLLAAVARSVSPPA